MPMTTLEACESVIEEMKATQEELLSVLIDCELHMILSTDADFLRLDRIRAAIAKATNA